MSEEAQMLQDHRATRNSSLPRRDSVRAFAQGAIFPESIFINGALLRVAKSAEIYREGDASDCWYKVQTGAVCTHKILMDGRRQIASIYLPGDAFGFGDGDTQCFTAEALAATTLLPIKHAILLLDGNPEAEAELRMLAMTELFRAQRHLLMLSQSAPARMAALLLDICERLNCECRLE